MIRPLYFGLFTIVSSVVFLHATAFAQTQACLDDFVVPSTQVELCASDDRATIADLDSSRIPQALIDASNACDEDEACLACTTGEALAIEAECAYCYSQYDACIQASCNTECGDDLETFDEQACLECTREEGCQADLQLCTEGDDTTNGDNGGGDPEGDIGNQGGNSQVDDPYGKTCSGGPDCKDGEWDVSQSGGRIGSACSMSTEGAGGIAIVFFSLLLIAQRRRRASRA